MVGNTVLIGFNKRRRNNNTLIACGKGKLGERYVLDSIQDTIGQDNVQTIIIDPFSRYKEALNMRTFGNIDVQTLRFSEAFCNPIQLGAFSNEEDVAEVIYFFKCLCEIALKMVPDSIALKASFLSSVKRLCRISKETKSCLTYGEFIDNFLNSVNERKELTSEEKVLLYLLEGCEVVFSENTEVDLQKQCALYNMDLLNDKNFLQLSEAEKDILGLFIMIYKAYLVTLENQKKGVFTMIYLLDASLYFDSASFLPLLYTLCKKRGLVLITENLEGLFASGKHLGICLHMSSFCIMGQPLSSSDFLSKILGISRERAALLCCSQVNGFLLIDGQNYCIHLVDEERFAYETIPQAQNM